MTKSTILATGTLLVEYKIIHALGKVSNQRSSELLLYLISISLSIYEYTSTPHSHSILNRKCCFQVGHIEDVVVHPEARGQGLGKRYVVLFHLYLFVYFLKYSP